MKRRLTAFLLLLCILFTACGTETDRKTEQMNVYYCAVDGGMNTGSAVVKKTVALPEGTDRLHEALRLLTEQPDSDSLRSAFPSHIRIETYSLEGQTIGVTLSEGYQALPPIQQTKLRACLVLTLCSLDEVENVNLYEEAYLLESGLSGEAFLPESLPEGDSGTELRFWVPDPENECLVSLLLTVKQRGGASMAETVLRQLMPMLHPFGLPEETQVLSVSRREGVCIIDFSSEFREAESLGPTALRLLLFSIVNTVTELDTAEAVLFRCEGSSLGAFGSMDLRSAFRREDAFTADMMAREDCAAVTLYLLAADGKLVPVKAAAPVKGRGVQPVETALRALLELETFWGYQAPYPPGTVLLDCVEKDGAAELTLGEGFWSNTENLRELTAYALAATAADAGAVKGIWITTGSGAYRNREILRKNGDMIAEG